MKNILIFFILLFVAKKSFAQHHVFDLKNKKPIESVNIYYNQNKDLITNEDGVFELPDNQNIDTLHFSHISYKSRTILVKNLKKNDTIFLKSSPIILNEVVLQNFNAKKILLKVFVRLMKII